MHSELNAAESVGRSVDVEAEGFGAWYGQNRDRVFTALVAITGDVDVAADATDEACVRAMERWSRVQTMQNPSGWVYRVGLNHSRRQFRKRALTNIVRTQNRVRDTAHTDDPQLLGPVRFDVVRAIAKLPRGQREAISLRYISDLPEKVVAQAMGIRPGTVARLLHDARQNLAEDPNLRRSS